FPRILEEAPRDRLINRIHPQGEVGGEHERGVPLRGIVGIGNRARSSPALGSPLVRAGGALGEFPLKTEQVLQVVVAPLGWGGGPGALQPAADRRDAIAAAK